jgi:Tfp pilus assembly protein FimT
MHPRSRSGFTITELMVGLAMTGFLSIIAMPKIQQTVDRAWVKSARTETFNRLAAARVAAQQGGRVVVFKAQGTRIWSEARPRLIAAAGSTIDTLGSILDLSTAYQVTVYSTLDSIVFDPRGLGGQTGTVRLGRGAISDSVAIVGFGSVIR